MRVLASKAPWSDSGRLVGSVSSLKASTRATSIEVKAPAATNADGRHCAQNPAINASTGRAAPTNPPKPRGGDQGSPRQHTTNDPTTSTVGTKHGVAVGSGVAAARSPRQEEPGSASHERQATCRQEEPGSTGDELAACRAQLAAAERKIGEQADSLRRREAEVATLREQLQEQQKLARRRQPPPPPAGGGDALGNLMRIQRENEGILARGRPLTPFSLAHSPLAPPRQALRAKVKELTRMLDEKPRSARRRGRERKRRRQRALRRRRRLGGGGQSGAPGGGGGVGAGAAGGRGGGRGGRAGGAPVARPARRARSRRPSTRSRSRTATPTSSPSPGSRHDYLIGRAALPSMPSTGRRASRGGGGGRPSTSQGGTAPNTTQDARQPAPGARAPHPSERDFAAPHRHAMPMGL